MLNVSHSQQPIPYPVVRAVIPGGFAPTNYAMSTTLYMVGHSWLQVDAKSLNKYRFYISGINGTAGSVEMTAELCPSQAAAAAPDLTAVIATATLSAGFCSGVGWYEFQFSPTALAAGTMYYMVLKCTSAPSHYPTVRTCANLTTVSAVASSESWGWTTRYSTDGTNWVNYPQASASGYAPGYTDGSYCGLFVQDQYYSANNIYGGRIESTQLRHLTAASLNIVGMSAHIYKTGTPSSPLEMRLLVNEALRGSVVIPPQHIASGHTVGGFFAAPVVANPGDICWMQLTTSGGDTGNYYRTTRTIYDPNKPQQLPFGGNLLWLGYSGSAWSSMANAVADVWLLLDPLQPFAPPPLNRRTSTGR